MKKSNVTALAELEAAGSNLHRACESCESPQVRGSIAGVESHLDEVSVSLQRAISYNIDEKARLKAWENGEPRVMTGRDARREA
jgi:hypothetical protein